MNRLAKATSPYLRQHATNPVAWYPWGPEALDLARREGRPILLSIGYAACHWCHVMAHESFEDPDVAALMNRLFVNIKVDREERPDLDRLYQLAHQILGGRGGGWPLTMFLCHQDQRPFFGGTYFPREARFGLPGFAELCQRVASYYAEHQAELAEPAGAVVAAIADLNPAPLSEGALDEAPLVACRAALERDFDPHWGGFGAAPKFPHPGSIARLMRDWYASAALPAPDLQALYMATLTLKRMAEGGLFDQVGGGFYRYSVDAHWHIPHFEKMLSDNALLLGVYAEAHQATGEALFREIAERTAAWMLEEMELPQGGFCSSVDADSEGHEGRYYVWSEAALRAALDADTYALFERRYGLGGTPNFEGAWHLCVHESIEAMAAALERPAEQIRDSLAAAQASLRTLRDRRVRPGRDEKCLTSWNALAIRALATAARTLHRKDLTAAATRALAWLRQTHWREGRLLAVSFGTQAELPAYLDDYVFLADAVLALAAVRFDAGELAFAVELMDTVLAHFGDPVNGGFYFTADDHEALIARPKSFGDDALPAGNAVAASVLLRLGYLLGEERYLEAAESTLRAGWQALQKYPHAHVALLEALEDYLLPPQIVLLRGEPRLIKPWSLQLAELYAPNRLVLALAADLEDLPPALAGKPAGAAPRAYLCRGHSCSAPIDSLEELIRALQTDTRG